MIDPLILSQRSKPTDTWTLIMRLFRGYLRPHVPGFIMASLFMSLTAAMTGAAAAIIKPITDELGKPHMPLYMLGLGAGVVVIFFLRGLGTYFHTVLMNRIGQRIVTDVQQEMYRHLLGADLAFFHANASGQLISRLTNDVAVMRQAVGECMTSSFKGGLTLIFLVGVMFYQNWHLAMGAFFIFPVSAWFVIKVGKRMRKISASTQAEIGNYASLLNQTFQGIRHVKAYGMEKAEDNRVHNVTENVFKLTVKGFHASALTNPMAEMLSGLAIATVFMYCDWQVEHGLITTGGVYSFVMAFILAYDPMKRTSKVNAQFQAGLAAAERVFAVLDIQPTIVDAPRATPLNVTDYSLALEDVVFNYRDGTRALDHLSITVPHGKTVAIVGPSGAGKSTIINLIPRFYDVQGGRIRVGGCDVRDLTLSSLRGSIALVSQETALFDDTVRANIAYGRPSASDSEIEAAAVAAFADTFIRDLPQGYDTLVGEHGVKLSGGQRQRIAIARAMLRNAPILLLDEATSALDNESERAVQAALKRLQIGRTTIVVAHRLSTIVDADQIVVLERGAVVEQGTHTELLEKRGVYARLYGMQSEAGADF
ncbi:MAG: ATP-binding cassette domain-containing protein [Alphaproteobacteria bacterium]|nr:ATP-binding cassette domain-containing protein [Alphaproteobacteria bacterium]MBV8548753.1 ATP-binding cassette domain-containing protein [Alphaproteobacteria bacterium]